MTITVGVGWFILIPFIVGLIFGFKVAALTFVGMFAFFFSIPIIFKLISLLRKRSSK